MLASCGGGLYQNQPSDLFSASNSNVPVAIGTEVGAPTKIIALPGAGNAKVALFPDGTAYYSPDGYNLGGGGNTVEAASEGGGIVDIEPVGAGIEALLSDGRAFFSPNGLDLDGGGSSVSAYSGSVALTSIIAVAGGVDAVLANGTQAYFSPDGLNLGGGGKSVAIYTGSGSIQQVVALGTGEAVVALFANGIAYLSPDNRNLGGGGTTVQVASPGSSAQKLVKVVGGVLTQYGGGSVYLSPDGQNLGGGGTTVQVAAWDASIPNGPYGGRDSAHGAEFAGHLWLSGGFDDPGGPSCFATCSWWDLWSSTDATGTTWNSAASFATATSPDPRDVTAVVNNGAQDVAVPTDFYDSYSALVVWNSRLFAIGSTVWSSQDGTHWARSNHSDGSATPGPLAPEVATENSRALILGSTLFFLQLDSGNIYSTTDPTGASWTALGAIPGYTPRCGGTAFVLLGKLWIEGGGACDYSQVYNDIWSSADGVNWTRASAATAWSRMWGCIPSGAYQAGSDQIVLLVGGYAPTDWNDASGTLTPRFGANHSDLWYTRDGVDWKQLKADYGSGLPDGNTMEPRHAATCYVTGGNTLMVTAGSEGSIPDAGDEHVGNTIRTLALPATLP